MVDWPNSGYIALCTFVIVVMRKQVDAQTIFVPFRFCLNFKDNGESIKCLALF